MAIPTAAPFGEQKAGPEISRRSKLEAKAGMLARGEKPVPKLTRSIL
jgi:hypothetical protein